MKNLNVAVLVLSLLVPISPSVSFSNDHLGAHECEGAVTISPFAARISKLMALRALNPNVPIEAADVARVRLEIDPDNIPLEVEETLQHSAAAHSAAVKAFATRTLAWAVALVTAGGAVYLGLDPQNIVPDPSWAYSLATGGVSLSSAILGAGYEAEGRAHLRNSNPAQRAATVALLTELMGLVRDGHVRLEQIVTKDTFDRLVELTEITRAPENYALRASARTVLDAIFAELAQTVDPIRFDNEGSFEEKIGDARALFAARDENREADTTSGVTIREALAASPALQPREGEINLPYGYGHNPKTGQVYFRGKELTIPFTRKGDQVYSSSYGGRNATEVDPRLLPVGDGTRVIAAQPYDENLTIFLVVHGKKGYANLTVHDRRVDNRNVWAFEPNEMPFLNGRGFNRETGHLGDPSTVREAPISMVEISVEDGRFLARNENGTLLEIELLPGGGSPEGKSFRTKPVSF